MADANALFKRHMVGFSQAIEKIEKESGSLPSDFIMPHLAMIYSACIVAESIRTGLDDTTA